MGGEHTVQILLIVITAIGTITIPLVVGVIKLFTRLTTVESNLSADQKTVAGLANVMNNQTKELNDRKTDVALIKKDMEYIKDGLGTLTGKIDVFIQRIDSEITIHHACPSYQEAKSKVKN